MPHVLNAHIRLCVFILAKLRYSILQERLQESRVILYHSCVNICILSKNLFLSRNQVLAGSSSGNLIVLSIVTLLDSAGPSL